MGPHAKLPAFSRWNADGSGMTFLSTDIHHRTYDRIGDDILGENSRGKLYLGDSDDEEEDDHHPRHRGHIGGSLERHMSIDEESMDGDLTAVTSESDDEDGISSNVLSGLDLKINVCCVSNRMD